MNGHIGLIHSIVPATVDLHVTVPDNHPSAQNLGSERVGSGSLIDSTGFLLTVHYVTVGATKITATLADGEQYPAQIAAQDQETGLSLVKIDGKGLPHLKLAQPDSIAVGQPVVMIASCGQAGRRVSGGYVTSTELYDGQWEYMIDKTLRINSFNPGYGGGTVANFRGEMVAVVSLNLTEVGKFTMAIPVEYYQMHEQELKQFGEVRSRPRRPWLGVYPQLMAGYVVLSGIQPTGPAARSGLRDGDIILSVDHKDIRSRPELYRSLWQHRPGDRIPVKILRDNETIELEIVGGDRAERYRS